MGTRWIFAGESWALKGCCLDGQSIIYGCGVTVRKEMDSLAAEGELKYEAATDDIERTWAIASTALAGCFLIADALDALTERIAGLETQPGVDSGNVGVSWRT